MGLRELLNALQGGSGAALLNTVIMLVHAVIERFEAVESLHDQESSAMKEMVRRCEDRLGASLAEERKMRIAEVERAAAGLREEIDLLAKAVESMRGGSVEERAN